MLDKPDDKFRWSISTHSIAVSMIVDNRLAIAELSYMEGNTYFFSRINVPKQITNRGIGTLLLKQLLAYCEAKDIVIMNCINAYGDLSEKELEAWYCKHGFKKQTINGEEALWFNADNLVGC